MAIIRGREKMSSTTNILLGDGGKVCGDDGDHDSKDGGGGDDAKNANDDFFPQPRPADDKPGEGDTHHPQKPSC